MIEQAIDEVLACPAPTPFVRLPLYPKQAAIIEDPAQFTITEATPKSGKTMSHIEWILEEAARAQQGHWWWVAPVKDQADIGFRRTRERLQGFIDSRGTLERVSAALPFVDNKTRKYIEFSGATLWFKSADEPDSLFGEDVRGVVGDEITRWKEDAWFAVYTTLVATKGRAKLIGNVKGRRNFAYHLARKAQAGEPGWGFHRLTADDAVEGGIIDRAVVEQAQRDLSSRPGLFRELFYAEASEGSGNPFGFAAIRRCIGVVSSARPVVFGVDLAKSVDWTWVIGLDAAGRVAVSERWQAPWHETRGTIRRVVGRVPCLVDSTGVGDPTVEDLQRADEGGQYAGYHFHPKSKQRLMEGLAHALQAGEVTVPDGPLVAELEAYEYEYTREGVRYGAPPGMHDDGVCALALAVEHGNRQGVFVREVPAEATPKKGSRTRGGRTWMGA